MTQPPPVRVEADALQGFLGAVFESFEIPAADARLCADVLVAADLNGVDSHGSARLPFYVHKLAKGLINPRPQVRIARESAIGAVIDGDNGMGPVVSQFAMDYCLRRGREGDGGCASVHNSNHFGIAGYYALQAVEHGLIGFCLTNGSPLVAPTFGREKMVGANPIALAVPAGVEPPFLLDMSTCAVAAGKLQLAMMAQEPIPLGWAIDEEGAPTTDPGAGFRGALLPLGSTRQAGSHKGYGLGVGVDVFCALLSGAAWGPHCGGLVRDFHEKSNIGHFFATIRVEAFRPLAEFAAAMDEMLAGLKGSAKAPGEERVFVHGEPEIEAAAERRVHGIPLASSVAAYLQKLAGERGLEDRLPELG